MESQSLDENFSPATSSQSSVLFLRQDQNTHFPSQAPTLSEI